MLLYDPELKMPLLQYRLEAMMVFKAPYHLSMLGSLPSSSSISGEEVPMLCKQNCLAGSFSPAELSWIYSVIKETLIPERLAIVVPKGLLFNDTTEKIPSYNKLK